MDAAAAAAAASQRVVQCNYGREATILSGYGGSNLGPA